MNNNYAKLIRTFNVEQLINEKAAIKRQMFNAIIQQRWKDVKEDTPELVDKINLIEKEIKKLKITEVANA